jgi:hypothetical protein
VLRLTLDTSSVIHGAQAQEYGPQVDELVDLARQDRIGLWITTAFTVDQERASAENHRRNLEWLSSVPLIGRVPGPHRIGYSGLGGPDVLPGEEHAAADAVVREILFPGGGASKASRRKITDVQHLTAHLMAGHDAFVTSDDDDMLDKRAELRARTGIVVVNPAEAIQMAHGQAA